MAVMTKDNTEFVNGGYVTRLQAWPKARGVAASTEAPEKPQEPEPEDEGDGNEDGQEPAKARKGRGRS